MRELTVVSYGGGINSTAMLLGMYERKWRPDAILFADTGGEHDETLDYIRGFDGWLQQHGFPPLTIVKYDSPHGTLEQECLNNKALPSLAFGFKGCSVKCKRQPMDKYVRQLTDGPVMRYIGIHAGEAHRGRIENTEQFTFAFPLIQWDWWQADCEAAILRHGLHLPNKSSCFFCPAKTKAEVRKQARERPDLHARCVAMERNARDSCTTVKGLGRHWSWEDVAKADEAQLKMFHDFATAPCGCWDGECVSS